MNEPVLKVGILLQSRIDFELKGDYYLEGSLVKKGKYNVLSDQGQITSPLSEPVSSLAFHPASVHSTFIIKDVVIGIGFHWEKREDQEFEGSLLLQIEEGKIRAINTISTESYLKSVISSEMSAMNDLTLLKVHAVVSRSWLLAQINRKRTSPGFHTGDNTSSPFQPCRNQTGTPGLSVQPLNAGEEYIRWYDREDHVSFDVCADDHCQRYQGITRIVSAHATEAVDSTRGTTLVYNGEICDARFSKCCGGITENFENVWQPVIVPYLRSVSDLIPSSSFSSATDETYFTGSPDAFCRTSDREVLRQILVNFDQYTHDFFRWKVEYDQQKLSLLIAEKSGIDFGIIKDLIPLERGFSGRIIRLKIVGTHREMVIGKELEIRRWLSESHLYSAAFTVEKKGKKGASFPEKFILHGAGWGHGVGMCQIGAAVMARKGFSPEQILAHYYPDSQVEKIY